MITLPLKAKQLEIEMLKIVMQQKFVTKATSLFSYFRSFVEKLLFKYKKVRDLNINVREIDVIKGYEREVQLDFISFTISVRWLLADPFAYVSRKEKALRQKFAITKYVHAIETHILLYKFMFTRQLQGVKQFPASREGWKAKLKPEMKILINEHAFQNGLSISDDQECLDLVRKDFTGNFVNLKDEKEMFAKRKENLERRRQQLAEQMKVGSQQVTAFSDLFTLKESEESEMLYFHEEESPPNNESLTLKRMHDWQLNGDHYDCQTYTEISFSNDMIYGPFLTDFDIRNDEQPAKFKVYLSVYRGAINLLTILQLFFLFTGYLTQIELFYLALYTFDFILGAISRGLIAHEYAYLRSGWNSLDLIVTIIQYLQTTKTFMQILYLLSNVEFRLLILFDLIANIFEQSSPISSSSTKQLENFNIGLSRVIETLRIFRLVNELKNVIFLQELRVILRILLGLFSKIILIALLIIFVLSNLVFIANQTFNGQLNQICLPKEVDINKFEKTASEKIAENNTGTTDFISYLDVNYEGRNFHPCTNSNIPFAFHCQLGETCNSVSNELLIFVGRNKPLNLTFDRHNTTWLLLLKMFTNTDIDSMYYSLIDHTGIIGFIYFGIVYLFGFYMFGLFLSIIYDAYDQEIRQSRMLSTNLIQYFESEADFSFDTTNLRVCNYLQMFTKRNKKKSLEFIHMHLTFRQCKSAPEIEEESELTKQLQFDYKKYTQIMEKRSNIKESIDLSEVTKTKIESYVFVLTYYQRLVESLRRFLEMRSVKNLIVFVIVLHFLFTVYFASPVLEKHLPFNEKEVIIHTCFTVFFVFEMLLKYISYGIIYFKDALNFIDLFFVSCNVLYEFDALENRILLNLTYLRFLRIMRSLTDIWSALRAITSTVIASAGAILTTFVVFFIIYGYLTLISLRLFETIEESEPDNLLETIIAYNNIPRAALSVFIQVFASGWNDAITEYLNYIESSATYLELIPNGMYGFVAISYIFHLIFKNLLIPQLFSNLEVNKLLQDEASIAAIILKRIYGYYYKHYEYINIFQSLGIFRLIARNHRIKLWMHNLVKNKKGVINVFILCVFILLVLAMIGVQMFKDTMRHCLQVQGGWIAEYTGYSSKPLASYASESDESEIWNKCHEQNIYKLKSAVADFAQVHFYFYNFDTTLKALESIAHIIYGDETWSTAGLLTSTVGVNKYPKYGESNSAIFFVALVICMGYVVDGLFFSIIMENILDRNAFPENSVWRFIYEENMQKTYLALETLKEIPPWHANEAPKHLIRRIFYKIIRMKRYDHFVLAIMMLNLVSLAFNLFIPSDYLDFFEEFFLTFYFFDGLMRYIVVGYNYFYYPKLIFFDIILPVMLYSIHVSSAPIGRVNVSIFIMLRFLAPDRYVRIKFLSKAKLMIKALVASWNEQFYMIVGLIVFLISAANIGLGFFQFTDKADNKYEPIAFPHVYITLPSAFFHLTTTVFGSGYDVSTVNLIIRSMYCKKQMSLVTQIPFNNQLKRVKNLEDVSALVICEFEEDSSKLRINEEGIELQLNVIEESFAKEMRSYYASLNTIIDRNLLKKNFKNYFESIMMNARNTLTQHYYDEINKKNPETNPNLREDEKWNINLFSNRRLCSTLYEDKKIIIEYFISSIQQAFQRSFFTEECASETTIRLFYFIVNFFAKLIILNILQSIVLVQYTRERMRDENDLIDDIIEYIDRWRDYSTALGNYGNHLPVRYATLFIANFAPSKIKILGRDEEAIQYVLSKYGLPLREKDMYVHLFDLLFVAITANFKCDPRTVRWRLVVSNLAPYISILFKDYAFDSEKTIKMANFVKGYYFGKVVLNASIQDKIRGQMLLTIQRHEATSEEEQNIFGLLKRKGYFKKATKVQLKSI
ncbi:sodium channel protein type 5 subunit alpha-like protein [Dinothrombium tinctorium]|uniref:Sodium channel protein type 5 subunit alpha-like protein n=1 Tax=Dinothrombium tinctorium TaxID=1965070 RepID=A0A3S3SIS5_9ACAR|nr:sodium channel protein type 5 subunit alpha-like protein [Dinothrombium tinctorium]